MYHGEMKWDRRPNANCAKGVTFWGFCFVAMTERQNSMPRRAGAVVVSRRTRRATIANTSAAFHTQIVENIICNRKRVLFAITEMPSRQQSEERIGVKSSRLRVMSVISATETRSKDLFSGFVFFYSSLLSWWLWLKFMTVCFAYQQRNIPIGT